jgi:hypothetical protein
MIFRQARSRVHASYAAAAWANLPVLAPLASAELVAGAKPLSIALGASARNCALTLAGKSIPSEDRNQAPNPGSGGLARHGQPAAVVTVHAAKAKESVASP